MARVTWFVLDVIVLLLAWTALSATIPEAQYILPSVPTVACAAYHLLRSGVLEWDIAASVTRMIVGFFLATCTAVPLGLLLGSRPLLLKIAEPFIELLRPISPIAWIPLSILWFGIGEASKIFIIWLIVFFFILLNTIGGILSVDRHLVEAARTLGASESFIWRKVMLPDALPQILVGLRLGVGVSIGGVVIAEMVAARSGIGFMMESARVVLNPSPVIIGMVVLGLLGYCANRVLVAIENAAIRHRAAIPSRPERR